MNRVGMGLRQARMDSEEHTAKFDVFFGMDGSRVFYLAGPTASGKSAVAAELAARCGGVVVNADAFQLYRGMPIITAQPSPDELSKAPHRLYGIWELDQTGDAGAYHGIAREEVRRVQEQGAIPIVTGGSGLYVKSLTHGLSDLPRDAGLRAELEILSLDERCARLKDVDEESWSRVDLQNPRYVTRALEITLLAGRPASALRREWETREVNFHGAFLARERAELRSRVDQRTVAMAQSGAVEEALQAGEVSGTAEKAIGFREWLATGRGEISLDEAVLRVQQATRQYAKRQETWFKKEAGFQPVAVDGYDTAEAVADRIFRRFSTIF